MGGGGGGGRAAADPGFRGGGGGTDGGCGWGWGAVGFWPDTKSGGGGGGEYDRVSGSPGYSTVIEFMRADINRQL